MPPSAGRRLNRKGDGEASCAAASGLKTKNSVDPACAAKCSLRRLSCRTCVFQNIRAPHVPERKTVSAAQSASAVVLLLSQTKSSGGKPWLANASAFGAWGGCSRTMRFFETERRAGARSLNSPIPDCWARSSTNDPVGHPPSGS